MDPLFELIQLGIGTREDFPSAPATLEQWQALLDRIVEHSLVGVTYPGVEKYSRRTPVPLEITFPWMMAVGEIAETNEKQRKSIRELETIFRSNGFRCCLLKGQTSAALYPTPGLRQSGDIDIWADGGRERIMEFLQANYPVVRTRYIHCDVKILDDVRVEVHFTPSWMFSPLANWRLQWWFINHSIEQFANFDDSLGMSIPTLRFNGVYMLLHIYRHVLEEGIGLRQLLDYYYLLCRLNAADRKAVVRDLKLLGLLRFAGAVMHVLKEAFLIDDGKLLCEANDRLGKVLMDSILESGNFGQADPLFANRRSRTEGILAHGWRKIKRNARFIRLCRGEVLWMPFFVTWQYFWRRRHGYLYKGR